MNLSISKLIIHNMSNINESYNEKVSAAEKMRKIVRWLDYQNEDFNSNYYSIRDIERVYDNREIDLVDNLYPDDENDEAYIHDAKLVNSAFKKEYYVTDPDEIKRMIDEYDG